MNSKNTLALIGESASENCIKKLSSFGFEVLVLPAFDRLPSPVASHADMLMFPIDDKIFLSRDYAPLCSKTLERLRDKGYEIILCDCDIKNEYPFDVAFNIAKVGNSIFANTKHMCGDVRDYIGGTPYSLNHVKQGYTKCSTAVVSDNAVITADEGIATEACKRGIDVLKISNSSAVSLRGYDYGFLGGACGMDGDTLYFCGNITSHPDYDKISAFCDLHGTKLCSLSDTTLSDVGGIFFFTQT